MTEDFIRYPLHRVVLHLSQPKECQLKNAETRPYLVQDFLLYHDRLAASIYIQLLSISNPREVKFEKTADIHRTIAQRQNVPHIYQRFTALMIAW